MTSLAFYAARLESLRGTAASESTERALAIGAQALRILASLEHGADDGVQFGRASSGRYYARLTGHKSCSGDSLTDALGQLATTLAFEEEERPTVVDAAPAEAT